MPNKIFFKDRESNIGGGKFFLEGGGGQIFFFFLEKGRGRTPHQTYKKKFNQKFNQSERSKLHNSQNRKFVGAAITVTKNTPLNGFLWAASFHLRRLPFISKTSFLGSIFTLHIYSFSTSNAK